MTDVGMPEPQPEPRPNTNNSNETSASQETRGTRTQDSVQAKVGSVILFRVGSLDVRDGQSSDDFWFTVHYYVTGKHPDKVQPSTASYEKAVKGFFPGILQEEFKNFLRAFPKASPETNIKREASIDRIKFSVLSIGYGSLDIMMLADNVDKLSVPFGITLDVVTAMLAASAPGALNSAMDYLYNETLKLPWEVKAEAISERGPSQGEAPQAPASERRGFLALISSEAFQLRMLNALYIVPILATLYVFVSTSWEMHGRIASYDKDLLAVKTDEIARAAERTKLLDAQEKDRRDRLEMIYKENADAIRGLLSDELKRAAARSDYFDQQQALLLQRYENLSKDSSETIKALAQKAGTSSKPSTGEDKPAKDAPPKSLDSK